MPIRCLILAYAYKCPRQFIYLVSVALKMSLRLGTKVKIPYLKKDKNRNVIPTPCNRCTYGYLNREIKTWWHLEKQAKAFYEHPHEDHKQEVMNHYGYSCTGNLDNHTNIRIKAYYHTLENIPLWKTKEWAVCK